MRFESFELESDRPRADVRLELGAHGKGQSNVPYISRHHECTYNLTSWGYTGGGPCALASDILRWFGMSRDDAHHWRYDFVIEFLSFLPKEGGVIPAHLIRKFISEARSEKFKHLTERSHPCESPCARSKRAEERYQTQGGF